MEGKSLVPGYPVSKADLPPGSLTPGTQDDNHHCYFVHSPRAIRKCQKNPDTYVKKTIKVPVTPLCNHSHVSILVYVAETVGCPPKAILSFSTEVEL